MKNRSTKLHRIAGLAVPPLLVLISAVPTPAQVGAATWDKQQAVQRQAKPNRVYHPHKTYRKRPKVEMAPLLTVQYRVLIKRPDGTEGESSLASVFHPGDQLRLGVTGNQDGFLYIIYQKEGQDGIIMFPDSRVNNGENYVSRNQEFILPPINCPLPNPNLCWYTVTKDPVKEYFIIVYSRDQIVDIKGSTEAIKQAIAGGVIPKEVIDQYIKSARPSDYKLGSRPANADSPASRYALWITNTNKEDNEEIILRAPLNKGS